MAINAKKYATKCHSRCGFSYCRADTPAQLCQRDKHDSASSEADWLGHEYPLTSAWNADSWVVFMDIHGIPWLSIDTGLAVREAEIYSEFLHLLAYQWQI